MNANAGRFVNVRAELPARAGRIALPFYRAALDRLSQKAKLRLINISAGGFEAVASDQRVGDPLWLDLPGIGFVRCQVRWRERDRFGAAFVDTEHLRLRFINGLPPIAND